MTQSTKKRPHSKCSHTVTGALARVIGGLSLLFLFALLFGLIVQLLWNWLMPALFGITAITFWQAVAIVVLAKILFGGFGWKHGDQRFPHSGRLPWHRSGATEGLPEEARKNGAQYRRFWDEEGREAFGAYLERSKKNIDSP